MLNDHFNNVTSLVMRVRLLVSLSTHSRPQRPRSFWSTPRIATSGQVQRHSGFGWLCKHNGLRPEPIRFIRLDSEHAQSNGKSVNRGLLDVTWPKVVILNKKRGLWGRAWVLMAHKGRPCPKGILFSGFRNIKRVGISHLTLRYVKRQGNLSLKRISSQYCAVLAP